MSLSNQVEVLEQDLIESETNYKVLEKEMENLEQELANTIQSLTWWVQFESWLAKTYPNAMKEYSAIKDIERSV